MQLLYEGAAWLDLASAGVIRCLCSPDVPSGEPHFEWTEASSTSACIPCNINRLCWHASELFGFCICKALASIFSLPPFLHITSLVLCDRCIGLVFHLCQSLILLNCFDQVMPILKYEVRFNFLFEYQLSQSLLRTMEFCHKF